ncbi:MAG: polysaccharide deacetylase family protein [Acidimicrobiales bacterium]
MSNHDRHRPEPGRRPRGGCRARPDHDAGASSSAVGLARNEAGYVCLSFDFDGPSLWMQRRMTSPTPVSRGEFGAVAVPRILKVLARRDIAATFFIPGHTLETYPAVCQQIVDAGHEVGLHGYAHELNPLLSPRRRSG